MSVHLLESDKKNNFAKETIKDWNLIIGCSRGAKERIEKRMTESSTYSKKNSTEFFCKQINGNHAHCVRHTFEDGNMGIVTTQRRTHEVDNGMKVIQLQRAKSTFLTKNTIDA